MPIPAILGLPWLAGVLGSIFLGLVAGVSKYVTKRFALIAVAITALITVTATFFAAINALLVSISYVAPQQLVDSFFLFMPSNAIPCISAILSAKLLRWVYDWNVRIIQLKLF